MPGGKLILSDQTSIKLNNLRPAQKSGLRKIVGRGTGSGLGKTCGRGHKGQGSRSGVSLKSFEGGQMRFMRRVPKRGFVNIFKCKYSLINLDDLQLLIDQNKLDVSKVIDIDSLKMINVVKKNMTKVKLLARGDLQVENIKLAVHHASQKAIKKIKNLAGSSITLLDQDKRQTNITAPDQDKKSK